MVSGWLPRRPAGVRCCAAAAGSPVAMAAEIWEPSPAMARFQPATNDRAHGSNRSEQASLGLALRSGWSRALRSTCRLVISCGPAPHAFANRPGALRPTPTTSAPVRQTPWRIATEALGRLARAGASRSAPGKQPCWKSAADLARRPCAWPFFNELYDLASGGSLGPPLVRKIRWVASEARVPRLPPVRKLRRAPLCSLPCRTLALKTRQGGLRSL